MALRDSASPQCHDTLAGFIGKILTITTTGPRGRGTAAVALEGTETLWVIGAAGVVELIPLVERQTFHLGLILSTPTVGEL